MVNRPATPESTPARKPAAARPASERRERARGQIGADAGLLGQSKLHPFGDLHTLQHLSARLARNLRPVFEGYMRAETRCWAEPLEVVRFSDYRSERGDALTAWLPMGMDGRAMLCAVDGAFVVGLLDIFFGGTGTAPATATDLSPAAEALVTRLGAGIADQLELTWEPVARAAFSVGICETNAAHVSGIESDEVMVVTRFGIAGEGAAPVFVDLLYPVATLKPFTQVLTGKVVAKPAEADAAWQMSLTRAAMTVRMPVRSVLAEPVLPLRRLMDLKPGDVIPIAFNNDVPIVIGDTCVGTGTVGTSNGRAAIRISTLKGPIA
ncbi:FliM/FliN family flagellar motor switch protein [uncultured Sphingomonas sp.]|mgnify:CR=1 FL=1|uniref:flagellar motor switch protein FliM n=1 Tax=uncultured Sphingomonas sp. TaxID=158754 RepID=UPI002616090A|nr:FliM/FliN family flagellar motor switch protein [uncultured Sphingomonas sp.]